MLEKWERSGLPLSRFAAGEGVARKTLYRWRRRLGVGADRLRRGRPPKSSGDGFSHAPPAPTFTEIGTARSSMPSPPAVTFEVVFGDGTMVRVPDRFDPGSLRILLETLRGC